MVFRPKREERSEPRGGLGVGTKVPAGDDGKRAHKLDLTFSDEL